MRKEWEIKTIGDCILENKKSILKSKGNEEGEYPFYISGLKIKTCNKYLIEGGNIYLPTGGNFYVHFYDGKASYSTDTWSIKTKDDVEIKYLYYFLIFNQQFINETHFKGATIKHLQKSDFKEIKILIPDLQIQRKITSILDDTFESIERVKSNAEQNLKNAKELFECYLQGVFENKDENWEVKSLGEIATFRNGMNFTKSSNGEKINIVGVKDFQNSFWIPFEALETVTLDGKLNDTDLLQKGDILTVRSNGNPQLIGRTLLSSDVVGKVSHSGFTIRIRLNEKNIDPVYLCNYLKCSSTRKILVDGGNGVGIKSLNQGSLSALMIPYPNSLIAQKTIVQKLDDLFIQIQKLETLYQQKLNDLEELKKSILQKAFNGELKTSKKSA